MVSYIITHSIIILYSYTAGPVIRGSSNTNISGSIDSSITFNCTTDGIPQPSITWYYNSTLLISGSTRWIIKETKLYGQRVRAELDSVGSVLSQLTLTKIDFTDHGSVISCEADNSVNKSILTYTLSIKEMPTG